MQLSPQDICQMCADSLFYNTYMRNVNVRFNSTYVSFPRESYSSRKLATAAIALWPWRQLQKGMLPTRKKQTVKAAAAQR